MKKTVFALMLVSSMTRFGYAGPIAVHAQAAQTKRVSTTMKGVIKKIDETSIILTPSSNKSAEVTFELTASATRTGSLNTGDNVSVTYHYDNGARVVTAVAGKANGN